MEEHKIQQLNLIWENLSVSERTFVVDFLTEINNTKTLSESKWYNTLGDIIGIFDPTGVVDVINGISYITQGDYFFGFLSMVAAIPYAGDVVAKPLIGLGKAGTVTKKVDSAMKLAKAGKTTEASKILESASKSSPLMKSFLESVPKWGNKLKSIIDKLPGKRITSGLRETIKSWIDLFTGVARRRNIVKYRTGKVAQSMKGKILTPDQATGLIKNLEKELGKNGRLFRNANFKKSGFMATYVWPGFTFGKLFGGRRATASLMRRTKFYAGFLDSLGLGNWVGPDELSQKYSESELDQKLQEYSKTPEAEQYWNEDTQNVPTQSPEQGSSSLVSEPQKPTSDTSFDILNIFGLK